MLRYIMVQFDTLCYITLYYRINYCPKKFYDACPWWRAVVADSRRQHLSQKNSFGQKITIFFTTSRLVARMHNVMRDHSFEKKK